MFQKNYFEECIRLHAHVGERIHIFNRQIGLHVNSGYNLNFNAHVFALQWHFYCSLFLCLTNEKSFFFMIN